MLIKPQFVKVKCVPTNIKYYKSKGYSNIKLFDEFEVDIDDLQYGSHMYVQLKCDYCGVIFNKIYKTYIQSHINCDIDKDCCQGCLEKKISESIQNKYGVKWYTQHESFQDKAKATMKEKYGHEHSLQIDIFKEKARITNFEKYGYEYASQSQEIKDKIKNTNLLKYGKESYLQTEDKKQKTIITSRLKYGTDYPQQAEVVKEKMKKTMVERYGVDNATKNPEILAKAMNTLRLNDNAPSSTAQRILCECLNGILNYQIDTYFADIFIPDDNIIIEWDGSGHDLSVRRHGLSLEEFKTKEAQREDVFINYGYKLIRIISKQDKIYDKNDMINLYKQLKLQLSYTNKIVYIIE